MAAEAETLCAVCLSAKVAPVCAFECAHSFCESCCYGVLDRGHPGCPLCRAQVSETVNVRDVLIGDAVLERRDAEAAAASRAAAPDEYDAREATGAEIIRASIARRRQEELEGRQLRKQHPDHARTPISPHQRADKSPVRELTRPVQMPAKPCEKTRLCLEFSHVCPEPVLVKRSFYI